MTEKKKYQLEGVVKLSTGRQVTIPKEVVEKKGWEEKETKLKVISSNDRKGIFLVKAGKVTLNE